MKRYYYILITIFPFIKVTEKELDQKRNSSALWLGGLVLLFSMGLALTYDKAEIILLGFAFYAHCFINIYVFYYFNGYGFIRHYFTTYESPKEVLISTMVGKAFKINEQKRWLRWFYKFMMWSTYLMTLFILLFSIYIVINPL